MSFEIKVGTFYKTKNGHKVKIYDINAGGQFPIHGAVNLLDYWVIASWSETGESLNGEGANIVQEWDSIFNINESSYKAWQSEAIANFTRKSPVVDPGTYFLEFYPANSMIMLTDINYFPTSEWDNKLAENTNWVKVSERGHFEGNSMEDVRFIPKLGMKALHSAIDNYVKDRVTNDLPIAKDFIDVENERLENNMECKVDNYQNHSEHITRHRDYFIDKPITFEVFKHIEAHIEAFKHIEAHIEALTADTGTQPHVLNGKFAQMCSCGGSINVHKKSCAEYRDQEAIFIDPQEDYPLGMLDLYAPEENKVVKCECGSEAVGSSRHSEWCAKYEVV